MEACPSMDSSAPGVVAAPAAARESPAAPKLAANQEAAAAAEAKAGADVGLTGPAEAVEAAEAKKRGTKAYTPVSADIRHRMKKAERDHKKGLRGALLLAQMTEQAFMEHQLAACHFTFYNFCEHAPALCVCVCLPP